jgi:ribosomal protein S27AE
MMNDDLVFYPDDRQRDHEQPCPECGDEMALVDGDENVQWYCEVCGITIDEGE